MVKWQKSLKTSQPQLLKEAYFVFEERSQTRQTRVENRNFVQMTVFFISICELIISLDKKFLQITFSHIQPSLSKLFTEYCCDGDQVANLQKQLSIAEQLLSRCPACINNLKKFFCHLTCSPNQSSFMEVAAKGKIA